MTGLRGEAAIVGIAELPAERRQSGPAVVHVGPVRAAGEDGDRGRRRGSRCGERTFDARHCRVEHVRAGHALGVSGSSTRFRRPRGPRRCDRGGHGVAGRGGGRAGAVRRSARRDAWLNRNSTVGVAARTDTRLVRGVEQQLRLAAGRIRDPVRQRRAERSLRADRAALCRRIRLRRSRVGADRGAAADQRVRSSRRRVPRQADHRRRRAEQPGDRRPDPHARDGDAGTGWCRRADRERRRGSQDTSPSGVDQGIRRAHSVQDAHLRRRSHPHPDRPCRRTGVRDGGAARGPTSTWRRSTTATRSPC